MALRILMPPKPIGSSGSDSIPSVNKEALLNEREKEQELVNTQTSDSAASSGNPSIPPNTGLDPLSGSQPNESFWCRVRSFCGRIANDQWFQYFAIAMIIINSLQMAIATFDFIDDNPQLARSFDGLDRFFLLYFTAEVILHFVYRGMNFFSNGWLCFDLAVVVASWGFEVFTIFRVFRIVRAFRVITKMRELRDLVAALVIVIPRIAAIFLLLLLIYFMFAVMMTEMFKTTYEEGYTSEDYFSRLDKTTFTLLQFMLLDDWSSITKELMQKHWWAWMPVLTFIVISTFIVINLIIAVICDAVGAIQKEEVTKHVDFMQQNAAAKLNEHEEKQQGDMRKLELKLEALTLALQAVQGVRRPVSTSVNHADDSCY